MNFDESFWTERYLSQQIGWDAGDVTTPIKEYVDQLVDKEVKILVPGCGYGHEVKYLHDAGFTNVFVVDLSIEPLRVLQSRCPDFPKSRFIHGNFFDLTEEYELILEQTFFSVFEPDARILYANKMVSSLQPGGKLVGVLFNIPLNETHPPFGGTKDEYLKVFEGRFDIVKFETCYNSITPRDGTELFVMLKKPMLSEA